MALSLKVWLDRAAPAFDGPDRLVGERIDYNLKTGTGVVYKGSAVAAPFYHLSAERMDRTGDSIYEMRRGVFTTCEGDDPPWSFRFGSGTADLDDIVYGRDASFWVRARGVGSSKSPFMPIIRVGVSRCSIGLSPIVTLSLRQSYPAFGDFRDWLRCQTCTARCRVVHLKRMTRARLVAPATSLPGVEHRSAGSLNTSKLLSSQLGCPLGQAHVTRSSCTTSY